MSTVTVKREHWKDAEKGLLSLFIAVDEPVARHVCKLVGEARQKDHRAIVAIMNALEVHMPPDGARLLGELREIAKMVGYPWVEPTHDVLIEAGKRP